MTARGTGEGWRRLHPLTIVKELGSLAWALVAALVLDLDFLQVPDEAGGTEAVAATVVFGYAGLRYLFTAYRLTDHALELRRGVLVRSFQSMPRNRVQSVAVNTGLIGRFLGIRSVEVSAADAEDIHLAFVSEEAAEMLRHVLGRRETAEDLRGTGVAAVAPLATLDTGRLLTFGLTEVGVILAIGSALLAALLAVGFGLFFAPLWVIPVAAWPVMRTVGLVGFRSWIEEDRIRMTAGILGRRQTEAPLPRIQALQVSRPFLRRLIGMETVSVVTGDVAISNETAVIAGTVAPLEPIGTWRRIADEVIGHVALGETHLRPSSHYTIRRFVIRSVLAMILPVAGLAILGVWLGWGWIPAGIVGASGLGASIAYAVARWRTMGWVADELHLLVRRGVFVRRLTVVPIAKVQDVTITASFFQRRLGLATVEVDTAGISLSGSIKAIDLATEDARELADHLSHLASRVALPDGV